MANTDDAEPNRGPVAHPHRLRVLVGSMRIEDGDLPPPAVGELGALMLSFVETRVAEPAHDDARGRHGGGDEDPDSTSSALRARAEPAGDGTPLDGGRRWDGIPDPTPMMWPTVLYGDGWSATWSAPRPVVGDVELVGRLVDNLDGGSRAETLGRFSRVQVVTETVATGSRSMRDVEVSPRWFDAGTVIAPDATSGAEPGTFVFVTPVPADPWIREVGVLVDFEVGAAP